MQEAKGEAEEGGEVWCGVVVERDEAHETDFAPNHRRRRRRLLDLTARLCRRRPPGDTPHYGMQPWYSSYAAPTWCVSRENDRVKPICSLQG